MKTELLHALKESIKNGLAGVVSEDQQEGVAEQVLLELSKNVGGHEFYFSKDIYRKHIHQKIANEFNGQNIAHLAAKYQFSERHVEKIIKADRLKKQPQLFDH